MMLVWFDVGHAFVIEDMTFDDEQFDDLIRRVRLGEAQAARDLVLHYEPEIRREVRVWLTDPRLRRVFDSLDICQSVFGAFFVRVALGQFDLSNPQDLFRLLATMAKNKVIDRHRSETSRRSTLQKSMDEGDFSHSGEPYDPTSGPEMIASGEELLQLAKNNLSQEELELSQLRSEGLTWNEIADRMGSTAQALRKRFERACDRICSDLD